MRVASLDIGTNSIILTLAEIDSRGAIEAEATFIEEPRLGEGLARTGEISTEALTRAISVLMRFVETAREFRSQIVIAFGTEVFRRAENGREAISRIALQTGVEVKILSPEEEARYAFLGATGEFRDNQPRLVFDIGGASTELIWGTGSPRGYISLPIGAMVLSERFPAPLDRAVFCELNETIDRELDKVPSEAFEVESAVGVGGTITTLSAMFLGLESYIPERVHGSVLPGEWLSRNTDEIIAMPAEELRRRLPFAPRRADILPAGALIVRKILERGGFGEVLVSDRGGRFGAIYREAEKFYT